MSNDGHTDHTPQCDHRDCDGQPAVARYEFIDPPARTFRADACEEHAPDMPAVEDYQ